MSPELGRRIAFTLGALLVYRIGCYIPMPGIDIAALVNIFGIHQSGLLQLYIVGGGFRHFAIFSLGILPYVTAAVLIQLLITVSLRLRAISQQGERGRRRIVAYTHYLALAMTAVQALGIAEGMEGLNGVVKYPGVLFELTTMLTLTAGTMFLIWIADQITLRGIGNGFAVILAAGFVIELAPAIARTLELERQGLSNGYIFAALLLAAAITALIVFVEGARRRIPVDYAKREIGGCAIAAVSAPLALKFNNAGIMPALIANWFIALPAAAANLLFDSAWARDISTHLGYGRLILFCALTVGFTLWYTAFLLDPDTASETLKAHGAVVSGIEPGEATAAYLDNVVSHVTIVAGLYLAFIFIIPEILIAYLHVPVYLGGGALLIVVCAIMDIGTQYRQQMQLQSGGAQS